jgi:hypothetical protein
MAIKTREDEGLISDLVETFDNLKKIKMKLNPKKCIFGTPLEKLLGYMVSYHGIDPNPKKCWLSRKLSRPRVSMISKS